MNSKEQLLSLLVWGPRLFSIALGEVRHANLAHGVILLSYLRYLPFTGHGNVSVVPTFPVKTMNFSITLNIISF